MLKVFILFAFSFCLLSIEKIIVEAEKISKDHSLSSSSITVIYRELIEQSGQSDLGKVIQKYANIPVYKNGSTGQVSSMFLRGANSEYVLFVLDDVVLNDPMSPGRSFDISQIDLALIEKIEILKGPQSALYGSDGLAGVVVMTSKKASGSNFILGYGSYNHFLQGISFSKNLNKWGVKANQSYQKIEANSAYNKDRVNGKAEKDPSTQLSLFSQLEYFVTDREKVSFSTYVVSKNTHYDYSNQDKKNEVNYYNQRILSTSWERPIFKSDLLKLQLSENYIDTKLFLAQERNLRVSEKINLPSSSLFFGLNHTQTKGIDVSSEKSYKSSSQLYSATHFFKYDNLFSTQGISLTDTEDFKKNTNYQIGLGLQLATKITIKTQWTTGFKEPSLYQRYDATYGNSLLLATKSKNYEVGLEYKTDTFLLSNIFYESIYHNQIEFDSVANRYNNLTKSKVQGNETLLRTQFELFNFFIGYNFMNPRNETQNKLLTRRPKEQATTGINFQATEKTNVGIDYQYIGERNDFDDTRLSSYGLFNTQLLHNLDSNTKIEFVISNLLNKKYESIRNYGTEGRSIMSKISAQF